jgi:hypothetical protein
VKNAALKSISVPKPETCGNFMKFSLEDLYSFDASRLVRDKDLCISLAAHWKLMTGEHRRRLQEL